MLFVYSMSIVVGVYLMLISILALRVSRRDKLECKGKITYGRDVIPTFRYSNLNSRIDKMLK